MTGLTGLRLYFSARAPVAALAVWAAGAVVTVLASPFVFELQIDSSKLPRFIPVWELFPALVAMALPALLSPRMWTWEKLGRPRIATCAVVSCALCLLAPPSLALIAGISVLPDGARYVDIAFNVVVVAAVALVAVAAGGRTFGPLAALGFFLIVVAVQQAAPELGLWLPIGDGQRPAQAQAAIAAPFALAATATWVFSRGHSGLAQTLTRD